MRFEKFEDIIVWQKSQILVIECYSCFRNIRDYSFRDQIQRAAVSVMNNIAEGFERMGNKEFKKLLYIAKGSCGEVRSMLYLAEKLGYINKKQLDLLSVQTTEISKMLSGLIKTLS
ncbi:four helix bundle protein [Candidatus Berkelbacteria bacterium CG10_big_fil_rev_8_21_14_0_10_43_13]|uniref:Four helix bundle protein n=1 Tax=Candidatus Berkelbacteria bacterium CG10_big_fil_rev_8_21_14_0_10_43_13 TaxID=1974514 RepID=A0A2H0W632_9BACT|nr:MAG: four helix bundle protein [Candidatus Berkelbacteria bacterium CG10_big_fil_rev_8_21_14_0_10_43_13]